MDTFLFDKAVFGPIQSRRLGNSLGINLLPITYKHCNFDCIYCECGWSQSNELKKDAMLNQDELKKLLEEKLKELCDLNQKVDAFTFAGNGEPTLHPKFAEMVDIVLSARDKYYPKAKVTLLSNGVRLQVPKIASAMKKLDQCILKLDAGGDELFQLINQPVKNLSLTDIVGLYTQFNGPIIIQSLFLKGNHNGRDVSNLHPNHINKWLKVIEKIKPVFVMIYSLDRVTPADGLQKASEAELKEIKNKLTSMNIASEIYI